MFSMRIKIGYIYAIFLLHVVHAKSKQRTNVCIVDLKHTSCQCLHLCNVPSFMYHPELCCPPLKRAARLGGCFSPTQHFPLMRTWHMLELHSLHTHMSGQNTRRTTAHTLTCCSRLFTIHWLSHSGLFSNTRTALISLLHSFVPFWFKMRGALLNVVNMTFKI